MRALEVNAMTEKCVKGYIVASIVEGVRSALDQGRIDSDCVDLVLGSHAALLEEKIDPFRWYPVELLEGLNRLLAKAQGGDQRTAMLELGAKQFELLLAMGVHQQLSFSEGQVNQSSVREIASWGRLVSTMMRTVYNFSDASFDVDPEDPPLGVCFDAEPFDDAIRQGLQGEGRVETQGPLVQREDSHEL